ncbi:MAG: RDD family protein [Actinomycetota bacterium]
MSDAPPTPARVKHRLAARLLDAVTLTWALGFVLVEIDQRLLGGDPFGQRPLQIDITQGRSLLLVIVTIAAYEVVPTVWKGATLGKVLVGLRLRTVEPTARVPWSRAVARALVLYGAPVALGAFGGLFLLVLVASFVIPASGRGLHDRLAGTTVVALPREDEPA